MVFVHQIENLLDVLENNSNDAKNKSGVKNLKTLLVNSSLGLSGVLLQPASSNSFITSYFERFRQIIEAMSDISFQSVLERTKYIEKYDTHTKVLEIHLLHSILFILVQQHFHLDKSNFIRFQERKKSACLQILFTGVVHLLVHGSKVDLKKVICLYQVIQNFVLLSYHENKIHTTISLR